MPVEVIDSDGTIIEFPDGTPDATMVSVMRRRDMERDARMRATPKERLKPQRPPGYVSRQQAQADPSRAAEREGYLTRNYTPEAGGVAGLSQGVTAGLGDEVEGGINALAAGAEGLFRGGVPEAMQRGRQAYEDTVDTTRLFVDRARREHPGVALTNEVGGGLLTGGAGAARLGSNVAARGLPLLVRQTGEAAAMGSAYGYAAGFGNNTGDLQSRMRAGNETAAFGAGIGAVAPTAVNAFRPAAVALAEQGGRALGAAGRAFRAVPTPDPNSVGVFGGNLGAPRRALQPRRQPTPQPQPIPQGNRIASMFERARVSPDEFAARARSARENPQGEVLADLAEGTGVRTLRPVVQAPGQTGARADPIARERFQAAPEVITNALKRSLQVSESRATAIARLEQDYRALSANAYEPHWQQEVTPRQMQLYEERIAPLLSPENPNAAEREVMQDAIRRAERQFGLDKANGIVQGEILDNLPRYLHYIKGALGDAAQFAATPLRGTSGREIASLRQMYRRFADLLDPPPVAGQQVEAIIPGYRNTSRQAGDYFTAVEALDEGAKWLGMSAEEIARRRGQMGAFELQHARIGLVDAISESVGLAARSNGNVNVAGRQMFSSPEMRRRITAAFDTPEQAAEFLSTVNRQDELMRLAGQWGTGSQTQGNQAYEADGVGAAVAEFGGDLLGGRWGQAVNRAGRQIGNYVRDGAVERANDQFGEQVLTRIDNDTARAFTDRVEQLLRQRAAARTAATVTARTGGASGATVAGGRRE